jgi:small subunit ribosomal protein S6
MPIYETVFMTRQDVGAQQVEELTKMFSEIITKAGGKIAKTEQWGLRTLAYKINKARKAHYTLIEMEAPAPALHEMERQMRIHDDVVRYLSIAREELSKGPSTIIDKNAENETYSREEEAA